MPFDFGFSCINNYTYERWLKDRQKFPAKVPVVKQDNINVLGAYGKGPENKLLILWTESFAFKFAPGRCAGVQWYIYYQAQNCHRLLLNSP